MNQVSLPSHGLELAQQTPPSFPMNLVWFSEADLAGISDVFVQFHANYTPFFQTKTRSVAKHACNYLHGQLFTKQRANLVQYCREVPESEYQSMQHFISDSPWDFDGLKTQLQQDVCGLLGDEVDGAWILDESGIPKQGEMSVGVARQYCGTLGKVDNCQVGVYLAYTTPCYTTLVDFRLYLPESWIEDSSRRIKCGVPYEIDFQTKAQLGLEMILAFKAKGLPFGWVGFDAHYGEQPWLLEKLTLQGICYMAEIPANTRIFTTYPQTAVPSRRGKRGRLPRKKRRIEGSQKPTAVSQFAKSLPPSAWTRLSVRSTQRGELMADFASVRVWRAKSDLPQEEVWLLIRKDVFFNPEISYCFSNAPITTPLERLAAMQCRRYWVERALEDAKSEAGLDQYEVRGWLGWHHHMTMTLMAMLFLLQLTLRFREKAPLLTLQDAREILETFLPRKFYSQTEFIALIKQKHQARVSARHSHAKKQKEWLENLQTEI